MDFSQFSQLHNLECLSKQVFSGRGLRLPKQGVSPDFEALVFFRCELATKKSPPLGFCPKTSQHPTPTTIFWEGGGGYFAPSNGRSCQFLQLSMQFRSNHGRPLRQLRKLLLSSNPKTTNNNPSWSENCKKNRQNTSFCSNSTVITVGVDVWWYLMIVISISRQKIGLRFDQQRLHHCHVSSTFANQAQ